MKALALLLLCASFGPGRPFAPALKQHRHVPKPLFYKDERETTAEPLAAEAQVDRSLTDKVPVLDRAQNYLMASSLIYFFADLRMLSYCGYAATPFKQVDSFHGPNSTSVTAFKFLTVILQELEALIDRRIDSGVEKEDWLSNARLLQILDTVLAFDPSVLKGIEKGTTRANDLEELVDFVQQIKANNTMSRLSSDLNQQTGMKSNDPQRVYQARDMLQDGLPKMAADAIRSMTESVKAQAKEKPRFRDLVGLFSKQSDDETFGDTSPQLVGDELDEDTIIGPLIKSFTTESLTETSMFTNIFTDDVELVYFNDRYQSKKCVYAITVNKTQKRVTVTFRGTVSFADWTKNIQIDQEEVVFKENPKFDDPKSHSIGIHEGFYKFLRRERHDFKNGGPQTRFDHIIDKAKEYLEDDEWRLCATGHSLGGALATLFGFYAANDDRIIEHGLPVEVFSFASPLVGDARFRRAFKSLESKGKIMHARVCNNGDLVTMLPFFDAIPKKSGYQHAGLQIELPPLGSTKPADVFHYTDESWLANTKRTLSNLRRWAVSVPKILGAVETHLVPEYEKRLVAEIKKVNDGDDNKNGLDMDLDEYYATHILPKMKNE